MKELPEGGFAIGAEIETGSDKNSLLIKLGPDLLYCGSLRYSAVSFDITDLWGEPTLVLLGVTFSEVAPSAVTYSPRFITLRDFSSQINVNELNKCLLPS